MGVLPARRRVPDPHQPGGGAAHGEPPRHVASAVLPGNELPRRDGSRAPVGPPAASPRRGAEHRGPASGAGARGAREQRPLQHRARCASRVPPVARARDAHRGGPAVLQRHRGHTAAARPGAPAGRHEPRRRGRPDGARGRAGVEQGDRPVPRARVVAARAAIRDRVAAPRHRAAGRGRSGGCNLSRAGRLVAGADAGRCPPRSAAPARRLRRGGPPAAALRRARSGAHPRAGGGCRRGAVGWPVAARRHAVRPADLRRGRAERVRSIRPRDREPRAAEQSRDRDRPDRGDLARGSALLGRMAHRLGESQPHHHARGSAAPLCADHGDQVYQEGLPAGAYSMLPIKRYSDANGDGIITPSEVVVGSSPVFLGTPFPTQGASLGTTLTWRRRVRVSGLLEYRAGNSQLNSTEYLRCYYGSCRALNDPGTPLAREAAVAAAIVGTPAGYVEDAAFLKLREVTITLEAPRDWAALVHAARPSLTTAGRNLFTWAGYSGLDPEVSAAGQEGFAMADLLTQPPLRSFAATLRVQF